MWPVGAGAVLQGGRAGAELILGHPAGVRRSQKCPDVGEARTQSVAESSVLRTRGPLRGNRPEETEGHRVAGELFGPRC